MDEKAEAPAPASYWLWVRCGPCGHVWPAMQLPMLADTAARCMKRMYCPACGETKKIFMAQRADIPEEAANG